MAGTHSDLLYHIVFSTKNRLPLLDGTLQGDLYDYMGGIVRGQKATLVEIGGISDHVHLLTRQKPIHCLSDFMRELKSSSSKRVNEQKWKLKKFGWQDGYAVFTVSRTQAVHVQHYIQEQRRHHQGVDFKSELLWMLKKHEVEYDERYLWD